MFEIGNSLREARARRQVGIGQAEQATKIRGKYLRALEDEQFELLPAQTYVKGFLRTYADYLGLDGQLYVDEYSSRFSSGDGWSPRIASDRAAGRRREQRRLQTAIVLAALAVVAVLTVVVISAWSASGGGGSRAPQAVRHRTAPRRAAVKPSYLEITAARGPSKVIVNRAGAGGKILFEGTLERGDSQAFDGKRFWLNVGSPENLVITVAGRRVHVAGHQPWVLTVTPAGWQGHAA